MKSVSIVGANSYIARNLIHMIGTDYKDIELFLYDREESHRDGLHNYVPVNILDEASAASINYDVDAVIVFTGKTGTYAGFEDSRTFVEVNELGLLNVLNAMKKAGSGAKVVFPSTRLVYKGKEKPLREEDEKEFKTLYAVNKYSCEQFLKMYSNVFGLKYCIFRICVPYGTMLADAGSYGTAEFFLGKARKGENISLYGRGEVKRTLTYIGDLCRVLIEGALAEQCVNDVYNVGGEEYSLNDMARLIADFYHVGVEYVPWPREALLIESGSTVFDSGRLDGTLGVKYRMRFEEWIGGTDD